MSKTQKYQPSLITLLARSKGPHDLERMLIKEYNDKKSAKKICTLLYKLDNAVDEMLKKASLN